MLAARTTGKVVPCQQHAGILIARQVEHEIVVDPAFVGGDPDVALVQEPPTIEQVVTETGAPNRFQELFRNDLIGIDVGSIQRHDDAGFGGKSPHNSSLTSTK